MMELCKVININMYLDEGEKFLILRISNTLIEIILFLKLCLNKKIKIVRVKKMNARRRENIVGVFLQRTILI